MSEQPSPPDLPQAHRHFSVACFNDAWRYIDKPQRTPAEDEAMVLIAAASLWHWTQRPDCTPRHRSIGHWLLSRVHALTHSGEEALRHAHRARDMAQGLAAFYVGYAHEATARAQLVLGNRDAFEAAMGQARSCLVDLTDAEEREALEQDLQDLQDLQHLQALAAQSK